MSVHHEYFGKSVSFRKCPSTGKVFLSVVSGDLLLQPYPPHTQKRVAAEQRFEFLFDPDSAELSSCLRQLAEIIQG